MDDVDICDDADIDGNSFVPILILDTPLKTGFLFQS